MKESYICERHYESNILKEDQEKVMFWKQMLGVEIFEQLFQQSVGFRGYLTDGSYWTDSVGDDALREFLKKRLPLEVFNSSDFTFLDEITYGGFYKILLSFALQQFRKQMFKYQEHICKTVSQDFLLICLRRMEKVCTRVLITQLQKYKKENRLSGNTIQQEYHFFNERIAGTVDFVVEIFREFPVLYRLVTDIILQTTSYFEEILKDFTDDFEDIKHKFQVKKSVRINSFKGGFSDLHRKGKDVIQVCLEDGTELFYKPRSMKNEQYYEKLLDWLGKNLGINFFHYKYLTYKTHSWCERVFYKSCISRKELCAYYKRFGIQLFLVYLLGTSDLHFENLIAVGEYPVLIDLETLMSGGSMTYQRQRTAEQEIVYQLAQSVLYSGLLPYYHWNQVGKDGINVSAVGARSGQKYPFQVPVILNDKTSNMCVGYEYPILHKARNLACLNDVYQNPADYKNEILQGFSDAYRMVVKKKEEFYLLCESLKKVESRFLMCDTQRYSMILNSSYHPQLLRDGAEREIFLYGIWHGRKKEGLDIIQMEIDEMLKGNIPLFSVCSECRDLRSASGSVSTNYFAISPWNMWKQKYSLLGEADLEKQQELIGLSLNLTFENKKLYLNQGYPERKFRCLQAKRKDNVYHMQGLIQRLIDQAIWNPEHTEVSWYIMQFEMKEKFCWKLVPMKPYLYDGLAGMLLVFTVLKNEKNMKWKKEDIEGIFKALERRLFAYTNLCMEDEKCLQSRKTGAYDGEASVVFVYLQLFYITGQKCYLNYAKKHARIVEQLIEEDTCFDLINGNAGAATVFLNLYDFTRDTRYVSAAEKAVAVLQNNIILQERGVGWKTGTDMIPLSGAAHGNSGFLFPVLRLWALTQEKRYEYLADQIWKYENFLYDETQNNWKDMREMNTVKKVEISEGTVAWCHGAAGILGIRLQCLKVVSDYKWKRRLQQDICNGYKTLKQYWCRDSWSLCHGICGNLWVLRKTEQYMKKEGLFMQGEEKGYEKNTLSETLAQDIIAGRKAGIYLLFQEQLNPGFMNGYGGMIWMYLQKSDWIKE